MSIEVESGQNCDGGGNVGEGNLELSSPSIPILSFHTGDSVHTIWKEVQPFVAKAADWGRGEYLAEDVLVLAAQEKMQIWVFRVEGVITLVCVTQLIQQPRRKICNIYALAGRNMAQMWKLFFPRVQPWLWLNGVDEVQTTCRQEIADKIQQFGFEPLVQVLRFNLKGLS